MRIEYAEATGCPLGQFIVYAENRQEQAILRAFLSGHKFIDGKWNFCLHGGTYTDGKTTSFNFGYRDDSPKQADEVIPTNHGD